MAQGEPDADRVPFRGETESGLRVCTECQQLVNLFVNGQRCPYCHAATFDT